MEIGQTVMIMIVFFVLIIFALVFYVRFQYSNNAAKVSQFNEQDMIDKTQFVYSLGELSCSLDNVLKYDCIDLLKLTAFKQSISSSTDYIFYRKIMGNIKVEIEELYPSYQAINYTQDNALYDAKPAYLYSSRSIQMPVVLYNASDSTVGSYYFAILTVTSYFRVIGQ